MRETHCCCLHSMLEYRICSFDYNRNEFGWKTMLAGIHGITVMSKKGILVWHGCHISMMTYQWWFHSGTFKKRKDYGKPLGQLTWTAPAKWLCSSGNFLRTQYLFGARRVLELGFRHKYSMGMIPVITWHWPRGLWGTWGAGSLIRCVKSKRKYFPGESPL